MGSRRRRVLGLWRPSGARFPLISAHLHFHPSPKGARPNPCGTTPSSPPPRGRLRRSQGPGRVASLSDPRALKKSNRDLRIADLRRVTAEPRAARVWRRVNPPIERVGTSCRYGRHRNRGVLTRSIAAGATRAPARRRYPSVASPEPCGCESSRLDRSVADRHPAPVPASSNSYDGFQGRFHLLLHLRVCQRGSPRQARGPGTFRVAPSPGASPTAVSPADRAKEFFSAEPASDGNLGLRSPRPETATTTHIRRIRRPFRTRSDLATTPHPPHRRSPMPCSTRASPRTPTPRCDRRPPSAVLAKTKKQKPKDYQINGSTRI